jgi:hypothetical protein
VAPDGVRDFLLRDKPEQSPVPGVDGYDERGWVSAYLDGAET